MKYLNTFLQFGCFSFDDAVALAGNYATAASMLQYYTKHGTIKQVRKGLYAAINPLDQETAAGKFLIGTKLTETAVISHHSAFEYHGYANQVSYQVFVSSQTKFNSFTFDGHLYTRLPANVNVGIEMTSRGERITDIERTVLDSINDFEKTMGFEELIQCLSAIPMLNEQKILSYLDAYDRRFLYQKTGFILKRFQNSFSFSDTFFHICQEKAGNSSRYLLRDKTKGEMSFNNEFHLTYPKRLWNNLTEVESNADI